MTIPAPATPTGRTWANGLTPIELEWRELVTVRVHGLPVAQPRARARAMRYGGTVTARVYDPGTADDWKGSVKRELMRIPGKFTPYGTPLIGPLKVDITVYFPRPESHYGTGRNAGKLKASAPKYNTGKPDRDNLDKAILDAMTDSGFIRDDKQVVAGSAPVKLYVCEECGWKPGALIRVSIPDSPIVSQLAGLADKLIPDGDGEGGQG